MKVRWFVLGVVAAVACALPATVQAQFFFDNFDSYAAGSGIMGQGGWETWDNNPAANTTVSNAQSYSSPNSLLVAGPADIVHQFAGVTSGMWYAKAMTYVPSSQAGDMYFIVLNTYVPSGTNNWSIQVRFSASEGVVQNLGGTDNPRDVTLPIVTNQWVEVRAEIDLSGNQAVIYYGPNILDTQTYNVSGVNAVGAFDLFSDGSSESYMDNVWLDTSIPVELQTFDIE